MSLGWREPPSAPRRHLHVATAEGTAAEQRLHSRFWGCFEGHGASVSSGTRVWVEISTRSWGVGAVKHFYPSVQRGHRTVPQRSLRKQWKVNHSWNFLLLVVLRWSCKPWGELLPCTCCSWALVPTPGLAAMAVGHHRALSPLLLGSTSSVLTVIIRAPPCRPTWQGRSGLSVLLKNYFTLINSQASSSASLCRPLRRTRVIWGHQCGKLQRLQHRRLVGYGIFWQSKTGPLCGCDRWGSTSSTAITNWGGVHPLTYLRALDPALICWQVCIDL